MMQRLILTWGIKMEFLNIADLRLCTEAEGPGKRLAVWVQGCQRRCKGCCNPEMHEVVKKYVVSVDDFVALIERSVKENGIEGVSFIGGEPFLQAKGLADAAQWCHARNLSVLIFTGYLYEDLQKMKDPYVDKLLDHTDLLIDGEFDEAQYDTERPWIGSKNQKVYRLSEFYPEGIEFTASERMMEIRVSDKEILINGWPYGL